MRCVTFPVQTYGRYIDSLYVDSTKNFTDCTPACSWGMTSQDTSSSSEDLSAFRAVAIASEVASEIAFRQAEKGGFMLTNSCNTQFKTVRTHYKAQQ